MPIVSYFLIMSAMIDFEPTPSVQMRQTDAADIDHIGEIADIELDRAEPAGRRPGVLDRGDDLAEPGLGRGDVDPGFAVAPGLVEELSCA